MRDLTVFLLALVIGAVWGLLYSASVAAEAAVTLPPIEVTKPACEWGGPYPGLVKGTEMWIVICAELDATSASVPQHGTDQRATSRGEGDG
jgi:hypothetical protein